MRKGMKIAGLTAVGLGAVCLLWQAAKRIDFSRFFREDEPYAPDWEKKSEDAPVVNIVEVKYDDIYNRVLEESDDGNEHFAHSVADIIVENWVQELSQNIQEWIEHKPFSDIKIGQFTLNMILDAWGVGRRSYTIARAMYKFRIYVDSNCTFWEIFEELWMRYDP